ncbi:FixH family protein [Chryseobacterium gambrini]|uniref:FixH family protein n=1 Tax=Chryseobacterium gambrini TaxID=373672 RepID=A0AAJ1R690_9FLAO|nr:MULTISPECIES: FixH family protein [Chryseobacterium]MDN4012368.1 FixH family protein [Chryseobacterium gambrini]MDN4030463.1 FixH family protein [Chryseobacterium gambrini]QWA36764.1 FixH family protein [Chryseobacterium sp. ZHDP1]
MKNFNWGHGVIIALASFMIFILSMMFLFPNGQKNSEMVTDNYYEEELKYQDVIDAKKRADELKEKPVYSQNTSGIKITFPKDYNNSNTKVKFVLNRTDDQNLDVHKTVQLDTNQSFLIPAQVLKLGNYTLRLSWTKDKTDYRMDYDVIWK